MAPEGRPAFMDEDPFADEVLRKNFPVAGEAWERRSSSARCGKLGCIYTHGLLDVKRDFCALKTL